MLLLLLLLLWLLLLLLLVLLRCYSSSWTQYASDVRTQWAGTGMFTWPTDERQLLARLDPQLQCRRLKRVELLQ